MSKPQTLQRDRAMVLLIDVQTKLLPYIHNGEHAVAGAAALLETAAELDLPVMATVQYVKGLGSMHERLAALCSARGINVLDKMSFSVCRDSLCRTELEQVGRDQILVAGIEGHVCVQQTVLDLLSMNLHPFVCADAVSSRRPSDLHTAFDRMRQAGAVITTVESILFELCGLSGTPEFKNLLAVVKRYDEARLHAAETVAHVP